MVWQGLPHGGPCFLDKVLYLAALSLTTMNANDQLKEAAQAVIDAQPNSGPQWYMEDEIKALEEALRVANVETPVSVFMDRMELMRGLYANGKYSQAEQLRDNLAEMLDDIMSA